MPRQTKPTEDQFERVLALIRGGAGVDEAAIHSSLDPAEFDAWLHRGRNRRFQVQVANALAQADLQDQSTIKDGATDPASKAPWQAAKARMEMRQASERERKLHRLRALTVD